MNPWGCLGTAVRVLILGPILSFVALYRASRLRPSELASLADDLESAKMFDQVETAVLYCEVASRVAEAVRDRRRIDEGEARSVIATAVSELTDAPLSPLGLRIAARALCWRVKTGNMR